MGVSPAVSHCACLTITLHLYIKNLGGPALLYRLTDLYQSMWQREHFPQDFRDATNVHIYKRKGNRETCDNHHEISLLSITGKILARALFNRLLEHLEQGHLPKSQCASVQVEGPWTWCSPPANSSRRAWNSIKTCTSSLST